MNSKLEDTGTIIPALKGLVPLSALPAAEAPVIVRAYGDDSQHSLDSYADLQQSLLARKDEGLGPVRAIQRLHHHRHTHG